MATTTNRKDGFEPKWMDTFDFLVFGDVIHMYILCANRHAISDNEDQIFVYTSINLEE